MTPKSSIVKLKLSPSGMAVLRKSAVKHKAETQWDGFNDLLILESPDRLAFSEFALSLEDPVVSKGREDFILSPFKIFD